MPVSYCLALVHPSTHCPSTHLPATSLPWPPRARARAAARLPTVPPISPRSKIRHPCSHSLPAVPVQEGVRLHFRLRLPLDLAIIAPATARVRIRPDSTSTCCCSTTRTCWASLQVLQSLKRKQERMALYTRTTRTTPSTTLPFCTRSADPWLINWTALTGLQRNTLPRGRTRSLQ